MWNPVVPSGALGRKQEGRLKEGREQLNVREPSRVGDLPEASPVAVALSSRGAALPARCLPSPKVAAHFKALAAEILSRSNRVNGAGKAWVMVPAVEAEEEHPGASLLLAAGAVMRVVEAVMRVVEAAATKADRSLTNGGERNASIHA